VPPCSETAHRWSAFRRKRDWRFHLCWRRPVLCGFAPNLQSLLLFRILQGLGGGGMVPVSQSILASAFPPEKRSQGFALFGIAVVVAPVVGPTLGGWIADNFSWQWCFLINGPVGVVAIGLISSLLRESKTAVAERMRFKEQGLGFDLVGFLLVATFLGTLEIAVNQNIQVTVESDRMRGKKSKFVFDWINESKPEEQDGKALVVVDGGHRGRSGRRTKQPNSVGQGSPAASASAPAVISEYSGIPPYL
jgi:Major Facilitator Superfamily